MSNFKRDSAPRPQKRLVLYIAIVLVIFGLVGCASPAQPASFSGDATTISAGWTHTVGLRSDGTVVSTVVTGSGRSTGQTYVSDWYDIVAVAAGSSHTIGLRADGTVVIAVGFHPQSGPLDITDWRDIVAVAMGSSFAVGLRSDGTVVTVATVSSVNLTYPTGMT